MNYYIATLLSFSSIFLAIIAFWLFLNVKGTHRFFWDLITINDISKFTSFKNITYKLKQAGIEIAILEGRIKSLKKEISDKQRLIEELSNSNDELRQLFRDKSENTPTDQGLKGSGLGSEYSSEDGREKITNAIETTPAQNSTTESSMVINDVLEYDRHDTDYEFIDSDSVMELPSIEDLQKRIAQSETLINQIPLKFRTLLRSGLIKRASIEKELFDLSDLVLNLSKIDKQYRDEVITQCSKDQLGLAITSLAKIDRINFNAVRVKSYIDDKMHREYSEEFVSQVKKLAQAA